MNGRMNGRTHAVLTVQRQLRVPACLLASAGVARRASARQGKTARFEASAADLRCATHNRESARRGAACSSRAATAAIARAAAAERGRTSERGNVRCSQPERMRMPSRGSPLPPGGGTTLAAAAAAASGAACKSALRARRAAPAVAPRRAPCGRIGPARRAHHNACDALRVARALGWQLRRRNAVRLQRRSARQRSARPPQRRCSARAAAAHQRRRGCDRPLPAVAPSQPHGSPRARAAL